MVGPEMLISEPVAIISNPKFDGLERYCGCSFCVSFADAYSKASLMDTNPLLSESALTIIPY